MSGISTGPNLDARKFLQLSSDLITLPSRPISALCVHDKSADSAVCDIAVSALLLCLVSMDYPHGVKTRL